MPSTWNVHSPFEMLWGIWRKPPFEELLPLFVFSRNSLNRAVYLLVPSRRSQAGWTTPLIHIILYTSKSRSSTFSYLLLNELYFEACWELTPWRQQLANWANLNSNLHSVQNFDSKEEIFSESSLIESHRKYLKKLSKFENLLLFIGSKSWHVVLTTESNSVQCSNDLWVASQSCHPPNVHRTPFPFSLETAKYPVGKTWRQIILSGTLTSEGLGNRNPGRQLGGTI